MRIVAHRGASAEAAENTLAAFERAIELGADMIEFDVRRSVNGALLISHDPIREPGPRFPLSKTPCVSPKAAFSSMSNSKSRIVSVTRSTCCCDIFRW